MPNPDVDRQLQKTPHPSPTPVYLHVDSPQQGSPRPPRQEEESESPPASRTCLWGHRPISPVQSSFDSISAATREVSKLAHKPVITPKWVTYTTKWLVIKIFQNCA